MLVSIVIPCYNVADYIADAITSALEQNYPEVEVIVVDNGSRDHTVEVVQSIQRQYLGCVQLRQEVSLGAPFARNNGWKASKGDWIQFLDADDYLLPEKISRQLNLAKSSRADVIIGTPVYEDLTGVQTPLIPWEDHWKGLAHGMYCGQTSANLYSRHALERVGGWDETLPDTQDTALMFNLMKAGLAVIADTMPACVCCDRPHGKITQKDPTGILKRHLMLREQMKVYLKGNKPVYWTDNELFLHLASYRLLRMLAVHDPALAAKLYQKYLPLNFKAQANKALKIPAWNARLVNLMGIDKTEQLKQLLRAWFSEDSWLRWKERLAG